MNSSFKHKYSIHSRLKRSIPFWLSAALLVVPATSFSPISPLLGKSTVGRPLHSLLPLHGVLDGAEEGGDSGSMDFANFNPLKYQTSTTKKNSAYSYSGPQVSLRQTNMQELTNKLLNSIGNVEQTKAVLDEYREFLLEPLDDQNAVLEPDSIHSPNMSRHERYEAYRKSMNERLESCKRAQVRQVLESMRDYVLSFEDSKPSVNE